MLKICGTKSISIILAVVIVGFLLKEKKKIFKIQLFTFLLVIWGHLLIFYEIRIKFHLFSKETHDI